MVSASFPLTDPLMHRPFRWTLPLAAAFAACTSEPSAPNASPFRLLQQPAQAAHANVSDGQGAIWRQLTETVNLSWSQVATVCPRDGATPCWGVVGGKDLSGWVWATDAQLTALLARYAPAIATNPFLSGPAADAGVSAFFVDFLPTFTGGCSGWSCSFGALGSGWSATSPVAGSAVQATVQGGFGASSMQISAVAAGAASPLVGHFLWRIDPNGGLAMIANDDSGSVDSPAHGVVVPNVLANDLLAGAPATLSTVTLTQLSSSNPGVTLDVTTGAVSVAYGTRVGTYTLAYRACENGLPNCDVANVHVSVNGNIIDAVDDAGAAKTGGGIAIADLLANDRLGAGAATLLNVTLRQVAPDPFLALQPGGALRVNPGTPVGVYSIDYEICEIANPINCDQATALVTVSAYAIDAVNDVGTVPSYPGGSAIASVLTNDRFNGGAATLPIVTLAEVSASAGLSLDLGDGSVDVAAGTPGGTYTLTYRLCEAASPAPGNCDQATATVTVQPQSFVVTPTTFRVNEGSGGSFTVRLAQPTTVTVAASVAYLAGTMNATFAPAGLTFTPANWNVPQTVTYATAKDSDKLDDAATLTVSAAGIATVPVVINGIDKDRKANFPVALIQAPANGATVKGVVVLSGTATSTSGSITNVKYSWDSNKIVDLAGPKATYQTSWNTSLVPNGWHVIEMRATDAAGNDGRMTIKVFVNN